MGEGRLAHIGLEGGDAVTVTVEVDVDGMESVDTVVIKVETGVVVAMVVVVVDVCAGESRMAAVCCP